MKNISSYVLIHLFGLVIILTNGCEDFGLKSIEVKSRYSDLVLSGEITEKWNEETFALNVFCVLKDSGLDVPSELNISHAVLIPDGMCFKNEFVKGQQYVVFLKYLGEEYQPYYKEEPRSEEANFENVCGLQVKNTRPKDYVGGGSSGACIDVNSKSNPCPSTTTKVYTRRTKRPRPTKSTTLKITEKITDKVTKKPDRTEKPDKEKKPERKIQTGGEKLYRSGQQINAVSWNGYILLLLMSTFIHVIQCQ